MLAGRWHLRRLLWIFPTAAVLLAGCASLPRPGATTDSMLVAVADLPALSGGGRPQSDVVRFDGPTPVQWSINDRGWRFHIRRVKSGTYRFVSRTVRFSDGRTQVFHAYKPESFTVPASAVVLLPQKFLTAPSNSAEAPNAPTAVGPVEPADQRRVAQTLSNDLFIAEWGGRTAYGFGPYSPFPDIARSRVPVRITSDPPGSELTIDGRLWGRTPLDVQLIPGKHFVRLDRRGFDTHTGFIDVGPSGGTQGYSLTQAPQNAGDTTGPVDLVLEAFHNRGSGQDSYLTEVFRQSLELALTQSGLRLAMPKPSGTATAANAPAFDFAERVGARMVVSGDYRVSGDEMIVHAVLYDTRSRLVKASTLFDEKTGLSVFDSIDRMSADFVSAVTKALPSIGQSVVKEPTLTPAQIGFNVRVGEQAVIRRRSERPYVFAIGPEAQGTMDQVTDSGGNSNSRTNGPGFGLRVSLNAPLSGALSLLVATAPSIYPRDQYGPEWDFPLYVGPVYTFSLYRNDLYLGLVGSFHFVPRATVDVSNIPYDFGPFWFTGLNVETGVRFYTYKKLTSLQQFWSLGLTFGIYGVRFDWDLTHPVAYHPELGLYAVWGTHL